MSFSELHAGYTNQQQAYATQYAKQGFTAGRLEECRRLVISAANLFFNGNPQTLADLTACESAIKAQRIALVLSNQEVTRLGIHHDVNVQGASEFATKALEGIAQQRQGLK